MRKNNAETVFRGHGSVVVLRMEKLSNTIYNLGAVSL